MAQKPKFSAVIALGFVIPVTVAGVVDRVFVFVPLPSCPSRPSPQQLIVPVFVITQVVLAPAAIDAVPVVEVAVMPVTVVGVVAGVVDAAPATSPSVLSPQQFMAKVFVITQEWNAPTESCVAPVIPVTVTGVEEFVVEPFPSSACVFNPQHWTVPPFRSAHA